MFPLSLLERSCGPCSECCISLAVRELGKPYNVACASLQTDKKSVSSGHCCGIYDKRPDSCRQFQCGWLFGLPPLEDRDRPDKSGYLFDLEIDDDDLDKIWLAVYLTKELHEIDQQRLEQLIDGLVRLSSTYLNNGLKLVGVRLQTKDLLIPAGFSLDKETYPVEDGEENCRRSYRSHDGFHWLLQSRERRSCQPITKQPTG